MSQSFAVSPFVLVVILGCIVTFAYEMWIHRHKPLHESATAFGTAAWGRVKELAKAGHLCASGLILGRAKTGRLIRWKSDRHLITIAPTRSGKGVSCIIPNLLTYEGSAFVIDPKGENAAVTASRRRSLNQEVYVLDPWGISGEEVSCFNPLQNFDPESADLAEDAARIAGALVLSGSHKESHWENEAKAFIAGLILHVVTSEPERERHLPKVRELLTLGETEFEKLLDVGHVEGNQRLLTDTDFKHYMQKQLFPACIKILQRLTYRHGSTTGKVGMCVSMTPFFRQF